MTYKLQHNFHRDCISSLAGFQGKLYDFCYLFDVLDKSDQKSDNCLIAESFLINTSGASLQQ